MIRLGSQYRIESVSESRSLDVSIFELIVAHRVPFTLPAVPHYDSRVMENIGCWHGSALSRGTILLSVLGLVAMAPISVAQQGAATGEPLIVQTTTLPKAYVRQPYEAHLQAHGGITPLRWEVKEGKLPEGILLGRDGILTGVPTETGEFQFTVTLTDSGRPAAQRNQQLALTVVAPLMAQWGRYPKVTGQRLEGSITVSNQTGQDFDLTVIMMAVNEIGRATAIGYQRFTLKK
jgi:hypothetical protein